MKKPMEDLNGEFVGAENGKLRRFTKHGAKSYGRVSYSVGAPRVSVRDAGTHWVLERETLKK
jgi:hypothetical protein